MTWNTNIKSALDQLLASEAQEKIAVFDADGTLWHDDLGESFFQFQIENKQTLVLRKSQTLGRPYRRVLCLQRRRRL